MKAIRKVVAYIIFILLLITTSCNNTGSSISGGDNIFDGVVGAPVGWGENTTGGSGTSVTVSTYSTLKSALSDKSKSVIYVDGSISITSRIDIQDRSNFSIIGINNAKLVSTDTTKSGSGIFYIKRVTNMILQNITFVGPGAYDTDGYDNLCLDNCQTIWVDHCDFQDGLDGNFDIKNMSDNISVTWCIFQYKKAPIPGGPGGSNDHRYTNLIGSSDGATADEGKLNVTFYCSWWAEGCRERMPRVRFGKIHLLNCLFDSSVSNYCVRAGYKSNILIEGCYFDNQSNPIDLDTGYTAVKAINNKGTGNMKSGGTVFTPTYLYIADSPYDILSTIKRDAGASL